MDDRALLDLLRRDGDAGMEALLARYGPLLRYVVGGVLRDKQDAEDCYSEVTLLLWRRLADYDPERGSLKAWLSALARNTALNRRRGLARREEEEELYESVRDPSPTPEEALLQKERSRQLQQAIARLSSGEKALFYRKYYYLQSTAQIAAELGLTQRGVEGRLHRLRKRLRKELGGEWL